MTRPSFHAAWTAANRIYDPSNSSVRVTNVIGGMVKRNILHPDPKRRWENTCAVRISYVLNQTGARIPFVKKETVSGADGNWYFYRIERVLDYLRLQLGWPEIVAHPPSDGGVLAGQRGLLVFEISGWTDAKGHATLWDGAHCYDQCYFNNAAATYRTDRANFWHLS